MEKENGITKWIRSFFYVENYIKNNILVDDNEYYKEIEKVK